MVPSPNTGGTILLAALADHTIPFKPCVHIYVCIVCIVCLHVVALSPTGGTILLAALADHTIPIEHLGYIALMAPVTMATHITSVPFLTMATLGTDKVRLVHVKTRYSAHAALCPRHIQA